MKKLKVAFCGGGTGGHYYPAVAILHALSRVRKVELLYFTVSGKIDDRSVERDFPGAKRMSLKLTGLKRPLYSPANASIFFSHLRTERSVKKQLAEFSPDLLFSTGGYVSYPVVKAANSLGIPVYIHEQNSIVGIANKRLAKYAKLFFISFEESRRDLELPRERIIFSGNPVRESKITRNEVMKRFDFPERKPLIVVLGGSLGSEVMNKVCEELYKEIQGNDSELTFLHSTGDESSAISLRRFPFVRAFSYIEDLTDAIACADLVVSRGGATTIAELLYFGRKGIIIPWSGAAENHQFHNARSLERVGLGYVILEGNLTSTALGIAIDEMLQRKISYKPPRRPVEIVLDNILREESI
ncbi:MAG: UDP-N-acetylglucosamine--N-acetylmuramyl-(pentapeptide) pyrophosphoryl-undecaprenol N-acetylglucosamine transferase [Kosmotogaceae bacterium]|nr:UDP-N-acetylglucosamine--N-acetylmuramyl-(pentapeptide) pyrophosphoryl-undecaprenol N-acetylglucosamine transferase [Kosmotogaceae bacterium]